MSMMLCGMNIWTWICGIWVLGMVLVNQNGVQSARCKEKVKVVRMQVESFT